VTRRTRILATVGPSSNSVEAIQQLIAAGADAFRLNFSHGTRESHAVSCRRIREAAESTGRDTSIVQDLGGPKIRTGAVVEPFTLEDGDPLVIEHGDSIGGPGHVSCSFEALFQSVGPGDRLLVDDGRIELEVRTASKDRLLTEVVNGGVVQSNKGINVPMATLRTSALTEKDKLDLEAGVQMGVDLVAVSFVQSKRDLLDARAAAERAGAPGLPIIAKIEKPQAVEAIEEILDVADGLMVARGDLGVEVPLETVPSVQKRIVSAARRRGVPVILATQVLESMRSEPRPTRAEVTDAAHAVGERVDAIMLAGETAAGLFPVKAVAVLDAIIREAERMFTSSDGSVPEGGPWTVHARALCGAAVAMADSAEVSGLIAMTRAGKTARLLAAMRPNAPIFAITPNRQTAAALALVWGVTPVLTDHRAVPSVRKTLLSRKLVGPGEVVVFISVHSALGHENINFVHVERI
jgi:pyruvate kinase